MWRHALRDSLVTALHVRRPVRMTADRIRTEYTFLVIHTYEYAYSYSTVDPRSHEGSATNDHCFLIIRYHTIWLR